jgi:hypothetical protein
MIPMQNRDLICENTPLSLSYLGEQRLQQMKPRFLRLQIGW